MRLVSTPKPLSPARASPESLRRMRLKASMLLKYRAISALSAVPDPAAVGERTLLPRYPPCVSRNSQHSAAASNGQLRLAFGPWPLALNLLTHPSATCPLCIDRLLAGLIANCYLLTASNVIITISGLVATRNGGPHVPVPYVV